MRLKILLPLIILFPVNAFAGEGHDAGRNWAESWGIDDPDNCYSRSGGNINNSSSFTEGCLEYLQEEGITNEDDELRSEDQDSELEGGEEEE